ncbi:hypothetical protein [Pacificibacter sp. AS14]|uniref:hypothetical protein n=1 Tax=Pacificibacter sp. AS14 TaxID=3135785 RepID=UPI0031782EAF
MAKPGSLANKAKFILERTSLSIDDVQPIPILEMANEHLTGLAEFFSVTLPRDRLENETCTYLDRLASAASYLAKELSQDPHRMIPVEDRALNKEQNMPVYLVVAGFFDDMAQVLRDLELYPEWNDYYDDMARKLTEYAVALRRGTDTVIRYN